MNSCKERDVIDDIETLNGLYLAVCDYYHDTGKHQEDLLHELLKLIPHVVDNTRNIKRKFDETTEELNDCELECKEVKQDSHNMLILK
jgi:hypothetical protein